MVFRSLSCAFLALLGAAALAAAPVARPLVFCADASPEGFDPSLWRPWITMAHSAVYIPIRRDVKGFVMSPNGSVDLEGVWRE